MSKIKIKAIFSLVCNILIVVLTAIAVSEFFVRGGSGNMTVSNTTCFRYFTVDSNILAAVGSFAMLPESIRVILHQAEHPRRWCLLLKYASTCAVTLTFLTVMFFLGPMMGYGAMFAGGNLYMHAVNPILSLISFLFLERGTILSAKERWWGMAPGLLYEVVYFIMVIIVSPGWPDFYGFNMGGRWYVSVLAMTAAMYAISFLLQKGYASRRK